MKDWKIRQYYQRQKVQQKLLNAAQGREAVPRFENGFGYRPDKLNFPGDINHFAEQGAQEFHASVEKWRDPMMIDDIDNPDRLRTGWDLIIDIDCDESFALSKKTALLVVEELKKNGIPEKSIGVKFSGNRGFHLAVKGKAFPEQVNDKPRAEQYPLLLKKILQYLRNSLREKMLEATQELGFDVDNAYEISDIENGWSNRHLFKLPYSLHGSTYKVSLPIRPDEIKRFSKKSAEIDNVKVSTDFFQPVEQGEGEQLLKNAVENVEDVSNTSNSKNKDIEFERPDDAIPERYFPPTIKKILEGVEDGRKRAVLILSNFLYTVGYDMDSVEAKIREWNNRNKEPLEEGYIRSQMNWHRRREDAVPPPNYDTKGFYKDMGVYEGENDPNPVSYAYRKKRSSGKEEKEEDDSVKVCDYCGKRYYDNITAYKKHVDQCY